MCTILIEKLTVAQMQGSYSRFLEPEGLLLCSQGLSISHRGLIQLVHTHRHYLEAYCICKPVLPSINALQDDVTL
jgi:hypothetical protein